jgi:hypothetical protein
VGVLRLVGWYSATRVCSAQYRYTTSTLFATCRWIGPAPRLPESQTSNTCFAPMATMCCSALSRALVVAALGPWSSASVAMAATGNRLGAPWGMVTGDRENTPVGAERLRDDLVHLKSSFVGLGNRRERTDPGSPYQNARHERTRLTMEREVASTPSATLGHQERLLDHWHGEFSAVRPQEALAMAVPASSSGTNPRPYPTRQPKAHNPSDIEVRRVYGPGWFRWFDQRIGVRPALAGERISLRQENKHCWSVWLCRHPVSWLDGGHCQLVRLGKCHPDRHRLADLLISKGNNRRSNCQPLSRVHS